MSENIIWTVVFFAGSYWNIHGTANTECAIEEDKSSENDVWKTLELQQAIWEFLKHPTKLSTTFWLQDWSSTLRLLGL